MLERRFNQVVELSTSDGPITVRVVEIGHERIRLGFDAPLSVGIVRGELRLAGGAHGRGPKCTTEGAPPVRRARGKR